MTRMQKSEGVILQTLKFRDHDHILTLFTHNEGILKLFKKGGGKKNPPPSPLTQGEFIYRWGKNDLHRCSEISIANPHLELRNRYSSIEAACKMASSIHQSQMIQKSSPQLYALFIHYLFKIPDFENPHILAASFRLKILRHEGLLSLNEEGHDPEVMILAFSRSFSELQPLILSPSIIDTIDQLFLERLN